MTRLVLSDTVRDMIIKLAEDNPGAIRVCSEIFEAGEKIDRDSFHGGFSTLLNLDSLEIYGANIWLLYKDVCNEDITLTIAVLRAWQLGLVSKDKLKHAVEHYGEGIDVQGLYEKVKERLSKFKPKPKVIFIKEDEE